MWSSLVYDQYAAQSHRLPSSWSCLTGAGGRTCARVCVLRVPATVLCPCLCSLFPCAVLALAPCSVVPSPPDRQMCFDATHSSHHTSLMADNFENSSLTSMQICRLLAHWMIPFGFCLACAKQQGLISWIIFSLEFDFLGSPRFSTIWISYYVFLLNLFFRWICWLLVEGALEERVIRCWDPLPDLSFVYRRPDLNQGSQLISINTGSPAFPDKLSSKHGSVSQRSPTSCTVIAKIWPIWE